MKKRAYEEDERMQAVQVKENKMNSHGTTVFCNLCKGERSVLLIFLVFVFFLLFQWRYGCSASKWKICDNFSNCKSWQNDGAQNVRRIFIWKNTVILFWLENKTIHVATDSYVCSTQFAHGAEYLDSILLMSKMQKYQIELVKSVIQRAHHLKYRGCPFSLARTDKRQK